MHIFYKFDSFELPFSATRLDRILSGKYIFLITSGICVIYSRAHVKLQGFLRGLRKEVGFVSLQITHGPGYPRYLGQRGALGTADGALKLHSLSVTLPGFHQEVCETKTTLPCKTPFQLDKFIFFYSSRFYLLVQLQQLVDFGRTIP